MAFIIYHGHLWIWGYISAVFIYMLPLSACAQKTVPVSEDRLLVFLNKGLKTDTKIPSLLWNFPLLWEKECSEIANHTLLCFPSHISWASNLLFCLCSGNSFGKAKALGRGFIIIHLNCFMLASSFQNLTSSQMDDLKCLFTVISLNIICCIW